MGVIEVFEARIAAVAHRAALAADVKQTSEQRPPVPPRSAAEQRLVDVLGIDDDVLGFLWTLVARSVEPRVGAYLRAVWGTDARVGASLAQHLALEPVSDERRSALLGILDPLHPLRAANLITTDDDVIDVGTRWVVAQRVWRYLRGDETIDPDVASVGGIVDIPMKCALSDDQRLVVDRLSSWLRSSEPITLVIDGPIGSGKRTAVALAAPRPIVAIDVALLDPKGARTALRALRREVVLRDAIPLIANLDELWSLVSPRDPTVLELAQQIDMFAGPVIITSGRPGLEIPTRHRSALRESWPLPDVRTRRLLWETALGPALPDEDLDRLSMRFAVGAGGVQASVRAARSRMAGAEPSVADISSGVQDTIIERLGELAHRIEVRQRWDELVLPVDTLESVEMLLARVRHAHHVLETWNFKQKLARGTGVAALFSGPPGTGKTMVAGLIARALDLELYQVDLSRIVSKWVGETEKQLAKVFEAAEAGHALLLFDEADALFAKRSAEVKSAVDRYANLEVNYLLQRVESFGGVVVLTTNLDTSIDPALRRRLASHIVFGAPERDEQLRLWRAMLETGAPVDRALRLEPLADEFGAMTGANIRNAVLAAAFLAAEQKSIIKFEHLYRAARGEYRAMGHVLGKDRRGGS